MRAWRPSLCQWWREPLSLRAWHPRLKLLAFDVQTEISETYRRKSNVEKSCCACILLGQFVHAVKKYYASLISLNILKLVLFLIRSRDDVFEDLRQCVRCVLVKFSTLSLANHVEFDFFVSERCFAWSLAIWSVRFYFHTTVWSLKKCKRVGLDTHALQPFCLMEK